MTRARSGGSGHEPLQPLDGPHRARRRPGGRPADALRRLAGDLRRHRARRRALLRPLHLRLGDRAFGQLVRARRGRLALSGSASPPGLWFIWVAITSFGAGGYLAGRLRRPVGGANADERETRDGAHGILVWATSALVGAVLATAGVTGVVGAAGSAAGTAAQTAAEAVGGDLDYMGCPPARRPAARRPAPRSARTSPPY